MTVYTGLPRNLQKTLITEFSKALGSVSTQTRMAFLFTKNGGLENKFKDITPLIMAPK